MPRIETLKRRRRKRPKRNDNDDDGMKERRLGTFLSTSLRYHIEPQSYMVRAHRQKCVDTQTNSELPKSTNVQDKRVQRPRHGEDEATARTSTTNDNDVHKRLILYSSAQNTSRAKGTSLPDKVDDDDDNRVGDDNDDRSTTVHG